MGQQIERTHILGFIQENLERIEHQQDLPNLIINMYGIVGIGKTCLMRQIYEHFQQSYPVIFLNFGIEEHQKHLENSRTWQDVAGMLRHIPSLKHLPDQIWLSDSESLSGDEVHLLYESPPANVTVESATSPPLLLLLDTLDDLPYWKWVQEKVIKPLLDQQRTLIVVSSQSPLFWHFWELREQSKLLGLGPFTFGETQAFLRSEGIESLAETLYDVTGGYPLGLDYIVRLLRNEHISEPAALNEQILATYRHNLLEKLIEHLPQKIQGAYLEDVLQHIAAMGTDFDLASLRRQINEKRAQTQSEELPPGRINSTITLLNSHGFVLYDREERTYRLDPLLKNLIPTPANSM